MFGYKYKRTLLDVPCLLYKTTDHQRVLIETDGVENVDGDDGQELPAPSAAPHPPNPNPT
jgi:hypothetical protein